MATADIKSSQISREEGEKSSTYSSKSSSDKSDSQNTKIVKMADKKSKSEGQAEAVEFNLSDPEQLARQLDRVDLTEEESDELLREAYKVNKHLKMMLKQKQDKLAASLRSQSASSAASYGHNKGASGSILPPIKVRSGGGSVPVGSQRAYTQSLGRSSGNSAAGSKPQSKTKKARSPPQRQEWDGRFSYS